MPQPLLIIVFYQEMTAPDLATALEVIAPMSSPGFLAEARGSHHGCGHCHQVRCLPGLQARLRAGLLRQHCQLPDTPIKSRRIPQTASVAAHGLL
jgi:hypothetical protein